MNRPNIQTPICSAVLMALAAWQGGALAQTAADAKAQVVDLAPVVVSRPSDEDERRRSTVTKVVVGKEELARYGDATVSDVLKRMPGVTVGGQPGRGGDIRMRGLGGGYTQILLNGEPAAPGFSLDSLAPNLIERIEIQRTVTADKSAQAVAGSINIILKQAVRQGQKEIKLSATSERGRDSENLDGQISDREGKLSYTLAGSLRSQKSSLPVQIVQTGRDSQGNATFQRLTQRTDSYQGYTASLTPRANWAPDDRNLVVMDAFLSYNVGHIRQYDIRSFSLGPAPIYGDNDFHQRYDSLTFRPRATWTHTWDDTGKLDIKFGLNQNQRKLENHRYSAFPGLSLDEGLGLARVVNSKATDKGWTFSGKYQAPLAAGHTIVSGWEAEQSRRSENRIQNDLIALVEVPDNLNQSYDARVRRSALFAQDEWAIGRDWSAYVGLRWEELKTRSAGNEFDAVSNRAAILSPILQGLWKVPDSQGDQVRFGLSRTYKAPQTRDLIARRFRNYDNSATNPDNQGNPQLKPEQAWGLDLAYERHLEDGGIVSANAYIRRIKDVIATELFLDGDRWISQPANRGKAVARGVELETKFNLRRFDKTAPNVDLRANLARNWSRIESIPGPDNRLAQQTPLVLNLGGDWRLASLPLTLGGSFGFQRGGWIRESATQWNYTSVKRTLDVYGLWKVDAKTQVRASVANVLHQDQLEDQRVFTSSGSSVQETSITSTAPVFRLSLEVKL